MDGSEEVALIDYNIVSVMDEVKNSLYFAIYMS